MIAIHERYADEVLPVDAKDEESLMRLVDEVLTDLGWDLPPYLAAVYRDEEGMAIIPVRPPEALLQLPPFQTFPRFADLAWKSSALRAELAPLFTTSFYGWLLAWEGWGLAVGPDDSPEYRASVERARRTRTNYLHPDRRESRILNLVTVDGDVFGLERARGVAAKPDVVSVVDEPGGHFVDALRKLSDLGARMQRLLADTEQLIGVGLKNRGHR